jgi:hypothetical protein
LKGFFQGIFRTIIGLFLLFFLLHSPEKLLSQDSVKVIVPKDTTKLSKIKKDTLPPLNFFVTKSRYQYINQLEPDTITRSRFLWYPLKSIEEVFNFLPGYFLKYMDVGQRQNLNYDGLNGFNTGVFRFGRPINDLIDGSFDLNILSRNEIDEIELTNGFGDFLYDYSNGINIVQRQLARSKPYSEISFWQDRYNNLSLDANFHQNFFRKLNFNFGVMKHSYDGEYTNSDFDKWLGRFNFNFAFSNKVNAFLYANYSRIQRGLNGGINPDTIDINNSSVVFDPSVLVRNSDAYEIRERFDIDLGIAAITSKDSASYIKFQLFESNAYRKYADEENRPNSNGIYLIDKSHWINYGGKIQNVYNFNLNRQAKLQSKTEGEFDLDIIHSTFGNLTQSARIFLLQDFGLKYRSLNLNAFIKGFAYEYYSSKFEFNYGVNAKYFLINDSLKSISINALYQKTIKLPTYLEYFTNSIFSRAEQEEIKAGVEAKNKLGRISLSLYNDKTNYPNNIFNILNQSKTTGITSSVFLRLFNFDIEGSYQQLLSSTQSGQTGFVDVQHPKYSGNLSLSFHDMAFNNKLEYKIGATSRLWSEYYADFYYGYTNSFSPALPNGETIKIPNNATLDVYIIAKINKAIFGLTLENILNRVIFTTGVYPFMNRGGLANVISRFNITWFFLN